jgi:hypothetical protein
MASVFAIVSKAVFESDFPKSRLGQVLAIDRYLSKHPNFDQLEANDAIFLFTVRPKNIPWLVAVIERPKRKRGAWVGEMNRAPIVDLRKTIRALKFSTDKGIGPSMGGLGMTLQTPRKLTPEDVALLRSILMA